MAAGPANASEWGLSELYGPSALATIRHPDSVSASLLKDLGNDKVKERTSRVGLSAELGRKASKLLLSKKTYLWNMGNPCMPEYGARLIFIRGKDEVWVDFCFKCNQLEVIENSKPRNGEDFNPAVAPALLKFFKLASPKDRELLRAR
jgi:hypothetical protein